MDKERAIRNLRLSWAQVHGKFPLIDEYTKWIEEIYVEAVADVNRLENEAAQLRQHLKRVEAARDFWRAKLNRKNDE